MQIDQSTIFWVFLLLQPVGAAVYWLTARRHPHLAGPGWWTTGCLVGIFGFGGILLRGQVPDFLSINAANALVVIATLCLWGGLRAFFGRKVPIGLLSLTVLMSVAMLGLYTFVWPSLVARTVVVSLFNGFGTLLALREVFIQRKTSQPVETKLLGVLLAIDVALHGVRIMNAIVAAVPSTPSASGSMESAFLLTFVISEVARLILFMALISGRLQDERKIVDQEINLLAFYDPLTNLPNRRLLLDRLKQVVASSARSRKYGALLCIDLDNFKDLNDNLGHQTGDLLLQQVAQRLTESIREGDTVARLGGDEFLVILKDLSEDPYEAAAQAEAVGKKILDALTLTYRLEDYEYHSTSSIGVTLFANHQGSYDELLKRADLAMYEAKASGRNAVRFFDPKMAAAVSARAIMDASLRDAVLKDQFRLHYQAQVDGSGQLTGVEALIRWEHPEQGLVLPLNFISMAEDSGLILPLGRWVIETACAQLAIWASQPDMAHLSIAVNVSARQFHHPDFAEHVLEVLKKTAAPPQKLKLELTESLLLNDVEDVIAKMTLLKSHGVTFSLDDFGTGYSSLAYLKRLPLDQLKIDRSFVRDVLTDSNDASIARSIVTLAQSLGLAVIAEGVETEAQRDFLAKSGCHAYQGYYFGRPLPIEGFERKE
jgi:diguanylate cyclase (GGDEF)-like protein